MKTNVVRHFNATSIIIEAKWPFLPGLNIYTVYEWKQKNDIIDILSLCPDNDGSNIKMPDIISFNFSIEVFQ